MFRIMLLLCYSLIDTNTIPFYFSLSQIGRVESHTQRFGLTVSFRRFPPHSTSPIPQGTFSTFGLTLSHGRNICFYFAEVSARKSSETASSCDARKYLYYRPKLLFFSQLDNFLVQYNFGKVRFINLSNKLIHLQVQKRNCQRYPDSRMELVALSGS